MIYSRYEYKFHIVEVTKSEGAHDENRFIF